MYIFQNFNTAVNDKVSDLTLTYAEGQTEEGVCTIER